MFDSSMARRGQKQAKPVQLNLNSMMDMLSIILVFLLSNISNEEQFQLAQNLNLPSSNSKIGVESNAVQIKLTTTDLLVEETNVGRVKNHQVIGEIQGSKIVKLFQVLDRYKQQAGKDKEKDTVLLQADKGFSFKVLNQVMRTAAMAGYPNFRLAIQKD